MFNLGAEHELTKSSLDTSLNLSRNFLNKFDSNNVSLLI